MSLLFYRKSLNAPTAHSGFTLIELLTVIAIVGVLAAILIPVIGSVRDKAKIAQCTSNLRQMGTAINLYTSDHNGKYPGPSWVTIRHDLTYRSPSLEYHPLSHFIAPYLGLVITQEQRGQAFVLETAICPMFEENYGPPAGTVANEGQYQRLSDESQSPFGGRQDDGNFDEPITIYNVEQELNKPSAQIISIHTADESGGYGLGEPIYNGSRNYLFLDGHVELIEGNALPYTQ